MLGVRFEAAEVARRAEGDVEPDRRGDDIVSEPTHVLEELVGDVAQFALRLGKVLLDRVSGGDACGTAALPLATLGHSAALLDSDCATRARGQLDRQILAGEHAVLPELDVGADGLDRVVS